MAVIFLAISPFLGRVRGGGGVVRVATGMPISANSASRPAFTTTHRRRAGTVGRQVLKHVGRPAWDVDGDAGARCRSDRARCGENASTSPNDLDTSPQMRERAAWDRHPAGSACRSRHRRHLVSFPVKTME